MSSDALRFHTRDAINVTASVDIWAACPDCGKSLQFYSGQVCDSLQMPRNVATCLCGSWMLRSDVAITPLLCGPENKTMSSDASATTGPHERMAMPLRVAGRGNNLVVRDAKQRAVTWLRCERFEPSEIDKIVSELVAAVNQHAAAIEFQRLLAESLGRELCWDAIYEAVSELADERERMQRTIGELRGRISSLEAMTKQSHEGDSDEHGDTENETHNR